VSSGQDESLVENLKALFKNNILETKLSMDRRLFVAVSSDVYEDVIKFLVKDKQVTHLSTMTGMDLGEQIEVLSHFFGLGKEITIRVDVPKEKPEIKSIVSLVPGAVFYEREIHDLLGVTFIGHPDLARLVLSEDWPEGEYPLRRDYKVQPPKPLREA
jgi:Ni,Fe-hydrogenase III component G